MENKFKKYDDQEIYICINPEFDPITNDFKGFTSYVIPRYGHEYIGNTHFTREEAENEAIEEAERQLKEKLDSKPLVLFEEI